MGACQMSEWKEVWYVSKDGYLPLAATKSSVRFPFTVVAYTLGEQRRCCQACGGSKVSPDLGHGFEHNCQYCNATGWEYRKCD